MIVKRIFNIKYLLVLVSLLCVTASVFFIYHNNYVYKKTDCINFTGVCGEIVGGNVVKQELVCDSIKSFDLLIGTYGRTNTCNLFVGLYIDDTLVKQWEIDCRYVADNSYRAFELDKSIENVDLNSKYIIITSDGYSGNAVTLYQSNLNDCSGLYIDNQQIDNTSLCYRVGYYDFPQKTEVFHIIFFLILLIIITITMVELNRIEMKISYRFLLVWASLSFLYLFSGTPFSAPDEYAHFYRSFELSEGYILTPYNEEYERYGNVLPFEELSLLQESWESFEDNCNMIMNKEQDFFSFGNTSIYTPIAYAPQVIGINFAKIISSNVAFAFYSGRVSNWIIVTILLFLSIELVPIGKEMLALFVFAPMCIFEVNSLAPDGLIIGLSAFYISLILYFKYKNNEKIKWWHMMVIYIAAISISLIKIVYAPFALFFICIPKEKFKHKSLEKYAHMSIIIISSVLLNLIWLSKVSNMMHHVGADAKAQLLFIVNNPIEYYLTITKTILEKGNELVFQMFGTQLGWLNINVAEIVILIYCAYLICKIKYSNNLLDRNYLMVRVMAFVIIVSVLLLSFTTIYLKWSSVYSGAVDGLQGRYYISLIFPTYLMLVEYNNKKERITLLSQTIVLFVNYCACIKLLFFCL